MRFSIKLLSLLLLISVVSVFGIGPNTDLVERHLSSHSFIEIPLPKHHSFKQTEDPNRNSTQRTDGLFKVTQLEASLSDNTVKINTTSDNNFNLPNSLSDIRSIRNITPTLQIAGIDGTGGTQADKNSAIDGTGGPRPTVNSGIDGTGGTQPATDSGIDGTGGTQPSTDSGIDGTGGTSDTLAEDGPNNPIDEGCPGCVEPPKPPKPPKPPEPKAECVKGITCPQPPTIAPSIITQGTLKQNSDDQFVVNGTHLTIGENTAVTIDGKLSDPSKLDSGQIVTIVGHINRHNHNIIKQVSVTTQIVGSINKITTKPQTITILGQTVIFRYNNVIYSGSIKKFADLKENDTIKVSGFRLSNGELSATRIELIEKEDEGITSSSNKVTGIISNLNETDKEFKINELTVKYDDVTDIILEEGSTVNVHGAIKNDTENKTLAANTITETTSILNIEIEDSVVSTEDETTTENTDGETTTENTDGETTTRSTEGISSSGVISITGTTGATDNRDIEPGILAESINIDTPAQHNEPQTSDGRVEVEGFITEFTNAENFKVGDITVFTDLQVKYIGNERRHLALDVKVEIEGYLKDEILIAEKVIFLTANLTSHKDRTRISSSTETFTWDDVGADSYYLTIWSPTRGSFYGEWFDGDETECDETECDEISVTISGLPENSADLHLFLYSYHGEIWSRKYYVLYGTGAMGKPELTSHKHLDVLKSTTATFTFGELPGADSYRLKIFNYHSGEVHYENTFDSPEPVTLTDLPNNGADINIHLYAIKNGWGDGVHYDLKSVQEVRNATIISHTNKQTVSSSTETFVWEDVGAEQYEIRLARRDVRGWFETVELITVNGSTTSVTFDDLPINGGPFLIRLRTKHSGWATEYYEFYGVNTIPKAEFTSHSNREKLTSSSDTFTWTEVPEASEYRVTMSNLIVDGAQFISEDYNSFVTSETFHNLPRNGAIIHLNIATKHNGYWAHSGLEIYGTGEIPDAEITNYEFVDNGENLTATFYWNDVGADAYSLKIFNTTAGPWRTIYEERFDAQTTSTTVEVPKGSKLFLRMSSKHGVGWGANHLGIETDE